MQTLPNQIPLEPAEMISLSWALKGKVGLLYNPDGLCLHQWIVIQKCSC